MTTRWATILPLALATAIPALVMSCRSTATGDGASSEAPYGATTSVATVGDSARSFPHAVHAGRGMVCDDCHEWEPGQAAMGYPSIEDDCTGCHDAEEEGAPATLIRAYQKMPAEQRWARLSHFEDLKFRHAVHLTEEQYEDEGESCKSCHGTMAEAAELTGAAAPSMETCQNCHEEKKAPNTCVACHERVHLVKPSSHRRAWTRTHGARVHQAGGMREAGCADCHQERDCVSCHRAEAPTTHTVAFTRKGHGLDAAMDRERCLTCHRQDSCTRCHSETAPASHRRAQWGGSRNAHCAGCHFPLAATECGVCHKATVGHRQAPRRPGDTRHQAAAEGACRTCHGVGLVHLDNGDDCRQCH